MTKFSNKTCNATPSIRSFSLRRASHLASAADRTAQRPAPPSKAVPRLQNVSEQEIEGSSYKVKGSCYGCGADLQLSSSADPGFVEQDRYLQKLKHKQLDQLMCRRCRQLSHGQMVPAVKDAWSTRVGSLQRTAGKELISPERLKDELAGIREKRVVVVLLVDLLDASGSFVAKLRDMTGRNPVVLIGTKADLLPKGTDIERVERWLYNLALSRKLNVIHTCTVSSRTQAGIPEAAAFIRMNRQGRDVFIVGAANVGKSAFSRALMQEMGNMLSKQYDPLAAGSGKRLPVESAQPGTTLKSIPLKAFQTGGALIDTPGLHLAHRLPHMLQPEEAKELQPQKRLRPFVAPSLALVSLPISEKENLGSYFWGNLVRIDVKSQARDVFLTFYGPACLRVSTVAGDSGDSDKLQLESVKAAGGLHLIKQVTLQSGSQQGSLGDIAISGLQGWVAVAAEGRGRIDIRVWTLRGMEAYLRPALPCPNPAIDVEIRQASQ